MLPGQQRNTVPKAWQLNLVKDTVTNANIEAASSSIVSQSTTINHDVPATGRITPERKNFLQGRLRKAVAAQPELERLNALLLGIGGSFLVPPFHPDPFVPLVLEWGFLMVGPVSFKPMKASMCHQNVAALWKGRHKGVVGIATGYGLSDDGLWRRHSWATLRDGVLETTEERQRYFGILLQDWGADCFVSICDADDGTAPCRANIVMESKRKP
jgi:hypothetical protein